MNKATAVTGPAPVRPVFVGRQAGRDDAAAHLIYGYMTAPQMQARIAQLTGYEHQDFVTFADILGRNDPQSGTRTNADPSLLTILLMQKISAEVSAMVMERELFVSDAERLVFNGIDLAAAPSEAALEAFFSSLYRQWLGVPLGRVGLRLFQEVFHAALAAKGPTAAYQAFLVVMLEHGGLYYV